MTRKPLEVEYELNQTQYGFRWGEVLVERTASNNRNPKFQVIRVYAPNGEIAEIQMRPRSLEIIKHPKEKRCRK